MGPVSDLFILIEADSEMLNSRLILHTLAVFSS